MIKAGTRVNVRKHYSEPGKGLSYHNFSGILKDSCPGNSWDVIDIIETGTKEVKSVYAFSVQRQGAMGRHLRALGFDRSRYNPSSATYSVRCSQCEALCINGMPTHERHCPNERR